MTDNTGRGYLMWASFSPSDRLTFTEWFSVYFTTPLRMFRRRCKNTPELRERCVRYAVKSGATSGNIEFEAKRLAAYITGN